MNIVDLIDDNQVKDSVVYGLKTRSLDQKLSYIGESGKFNWLNFIHGDDLKHSWFDDTPIKQTISRAADLMEKNKITIFALASGDGTKESLVARGFINRGFNIDLYLVDFSRNLLELSIQNSLDLGCNVTGILADVHSQPFFEFVNSKKSEDATFLFTMLGLTYGNFFDQHGFLNTLYNLVNNDDLIFLDVVIKDHKNPVNMVEDMNYAMEQVHDELRNAFVTNYLTNFLNIKSDYGHIEVRAFKTSQKNNVFHREHYFVFDRNLNIECNGERIHFTKGESIKVYEASWYELEYFANLLEGHGFRIVNQLIDNKTGYFLFKIR